MTRELPIGGVHFRPLGVLADERGAVLHMVRCDAPDIGAFGEVYFSEIGPGVVKGWKKHRRQTQRLCVPVGRVRFVLRDERAGSETEGGEVAIDLGRPDGYGLLTIPPEVWYAFKGMAPKLSLVANFTDLVHDPEEVEKRSLSEYPSAYLDAEVVGGDVP